MIDFFKKLLRSKYVDLLEGEVVRLRAENRALTNFAARHGWILTGGLSRGTESGGITTSTAAQLASGANVARAERKANQSSGACRYKSRLG